MVAGSEAPFRDIWFIGHLSPVERLNAVARGIAEGNHIGGAALVRHSSTLPPHRDACPFQPRCQRVERRSIRDLPAEETFSIWQATIGDQTLLAVVHTKGTDGAAAINLLKPKLAGG
jgi:hypothetical protein